MFRSSIAKKKKNKTKKTKTLKIDLDTFYLLIEVLACLLNSSNVSKSLFIQCSYGDKIKKFVDNIRQKSFLFKLLGKVMQQIKKSRHVWDYISYLEKFLNMYLVVKVDLSITGGFPWLSFEDIFNALLVTQLQAITSDQKVCHDLTFFSPS